MVPSRNMICRFAMGSSGMEPDGPVEAGCCGSTCIATTALPFSKVTGMGIRLLGLFWKRDIVSPISPNWITNSHTPAGVDLNAPSSFW